MKIVPLVSGGLDSTVMALLAIQQGCEIYPLFIDYGQKAREQERAAIDRTYALLDIPVPKIMNISGMSEVVSSGLTCDEKDTFEEAFLPNRNLLFLTFAASYAYEVGSSVIGIGLLHDQMAVFPDQTTDFITQAQTVLTTSLGAPLEILAPLKHMNKGDVLKLAKKLGVSDVYSCHEGKETPCGRCIACLEYKGLEV